MPGKKIQELGKPHRKTEAGWKWRKNYRIWDANRRIFLYPENWIEPDLRLPARFRGAKGVRILLAGKDRSRRLVAAQTLAHNLGKDLYRVDLNAVVSEYIGEYTKNIARVFN